MKAILVITSEIQFCHSNEYDIAVGCKTAWWRQRFHYVCYALRW